MAALISYDVRKLIKMIQNLFTKKDLVPVQLNFSFHFKTKTIINNNFRKENIFKKLK